METIEEKIGRWEKVIEDLLIDIVKTQARNGIPMLINTDYFLLEAIKMFTSVRETFDCPRVIIFPREKDGGGD